MRPTPLGTFGPQRMHTLRHFSSAARLPTVRPAVFTPELSLRHARGPVRCLASQRGNSGQEKSWGEIADEVKTVAKDVAAKVGSTISNAVSKVVGSDEERAVRRREREERERQELYRREPELGGGGILGSLVGRAVGRMVQSALGAVGEQMRQAASQAAEVQSRAQVMIESDARVRERLGGSVRCLAPVSQSSMAQSINGRVSKVVSLLLPVVSSSGRSAQAQVRYVEGEGGEDRLSVSVRLPSGEVLQVGGGGGRGGSTIDVEWREV